MNEKNKIECLECGKYFHKIAPKHLKSCCGISIKEYREKYPDAKLVSKICSKNLSLSHKGQIPWNTGKKLSIKHCENLSKSHKGQVPWNKGLTNIYSDETIQKMKIGIKKSFENGRVGSFKGKKHSEESKRKNSESKLGKNMGKDNHMWGKRGELSPMFGRKYSDEHRNNINKSLRGENNGMFNKVPWNKGLVGRLYRINEIKEKGGISFPNFNINACKFFDKLNECLGWNGYHALNGNEYCVIGYFLDYYEPYLNLIIEWDEKSHYNSDGTLKEKDIIRQQEIEDFLGCDFIRIKEDDFKDLDEILEYIKNKLYEGVI